MHGKRDGSKTPKHSLQTRGNRTKDVFQKLTSATQKRPDSEDERGGMVASMAFRMAAFVWGLKGNSFALHPGPEAWL